MAEKKLLLVSVFVTFGIITFLSGYLLIPEKVNQTGLLIERFGNSSIDISNDVPITSPISRSKLLTFRGPSLGKTIVAVGKGGNVIEINTENLKETIVGKLSNSNISNVLLSPDGNTVIYSYYDTKNDKKHFYLNFKKDKLIEIKDNIKSTAFSPDSSELAYIASNNNNDGDELVITRETNIIKRLLKTRLNNAIIGWPSEFLSIITSDKDGYGSLFTLDKNGTLNKLISDQYNLSVKWSASGKKLIYSTKNDDNIDRLFYKDLENNKNKSLISAKASNCVWIDNEISMICGIMNLSLGKYEFYKISINDDSKVIVATSDINFIPKEISVSKSGDYLFVLNEIDSLIYSLKLKDN